MLSAILSSFNEVHNEVFWANLALLKSMKCEIIVVDGGSHDGTLDRLRDFSPHVMPLSQRSQRYNWGIRKAQGNMILLVHPRSRLAKELVECLFNQIPTRNWGAFHHQFDLQHPVLAFTSWYSNFVRGRIRGIFYLDHCLYFSADLGAQARFPEVAIFEDTYFCRSLRKVVRPKLLPFYVTTSAVRFRKNGVLKQSALNQILKLLFMLGVSEKRMNRIYERGLGLNAKD